MSTADLHLAILLHFYHSTENKGIIADLFVLEFTRLGPNHCVAAYFNETTFSTIVLHYA